MNQDFKSVVPIVKKALPLMSKYEIPATPENYELWYSYAAETMPKLNLEIEKLVTRNGHCTTEDTRYLYTKYFRSNEKACATFSSHIERLTDVISAAINKSILVNDSFHGEVEVSDKFFESLEFSDEVDILKPIITQFSKEIHSLREASKTFGYQLNSASKEINALKEELRESQREALKDSLTGLLNRKAFDSDITSYCYDDKVLCLVLGDIDDFKAINDTYGHAFGDSVLKAVADCVSKCCPKVVKAYRYGGEEFAILAVGHNVDSAYKLAEKVRRTIENISITNRVSGQPVANLSISLGIAQATSMHTPVDLIELADKQLYRAKREGKNCVQVLEVQTVLSKSAFESKCEN